MELDTSQSSFSMPRPGQAAPEFGARSTLGDRRLADYRGRWLVLFSHPADFTPVCTSEFIAFAKAADQFGALNCDLLGLSIDSLPAHMAWVVSIRENFGVEIPFPILEDPTMAIALAYGMIDPLAGDSSTVRATFIIDPEGVVRASNWYPLTIGRSVEEIVRLLMALQESDRTGASTPAGWKPGDDLLISSADTMAEAIAHPSQAKAVWYYRTRRP
ncbi:MAG: peroxiredoxin [Caulobacteraceae bacterium]